MPHHTEAGIKALSGVGMAGGYGRDLGDTRIVINACRRNTGAGIPVADHARHAAIDQTLRHSHGSARVGLIVFRLQPEGHRFTPDGRVLLVDIVNRQLGAVLQIFTNTGRRAGKRACKTDGHGFAFR